MNEFMHGPVWVYNSDGIAVMRFTKIYDDPLISALNSKAEEMYTGYFEANSHGGACWFNDEREKSDKSVILALIMRIIARLNEINDGSFTIEDYETERLKAL